MPKPQLPSVVAPRGKKSLTQRQFQKDSDINTIVDRYLPKQLPSGAGVPKFGDFTGHNFQNMMNSISSVQTQFAMLPASIRRMFQNSPLAVVQFVEDPKNKAKAIELGLLPDDGTTGPNKPAGAASPGAQAPTTVPPGYNLDTKTGVLTPISPPVTPPVPVAPKPA